MFLEDIDINKMIQELPTKEQVLDASLKAYEKGLRTHEIIDNVIAFYANPKQKEPYRNITEEMYSILKAARLCKEHGFEERALKNYNRVINSMPDSFACKEGIIRESGNEKALKSFLKRK